MIALILICIAKRINMLRRLSAFHVRKNVMKVINCQKCSMEELNAIVVVYVVGNLVS